MPQLIHLAYISTAVNNFTKEELNQILISARERNMQKDITGFLVYHEGTFLQVLEGNEEDVNTLMDNISKDTRHHDIAVILRSPVQQRDFADWAMGYADITEEELSQISGLREFFSPKEQVTESLKNEQVKSIISAFKSGAWRRKIS